MILDPQSGDEIAILDIHQHLAAGEKLERAEPHATRLGMMDRFGIDQAVLMPASGSFGERPRMETVNDTTSAVVDSDRGRFPVGVATIDPLRPLADQRAEIRRAVNVLGLRGAVWHHRFDGVRIDHESMPAILAECADLGVPGFIHVIGESTLEAPWRLESVLRLVPDVQVVLLAPFSTNDRGGLSMEVARRWPNVHFDLGAMSSASGYQLTSFISEFGAERLILGTDLYVEPMTYYFPHAIHEVVHLPISADEKRLILALNTRRLMGITS